MVAPKSLPVHTDKIRSVRPSVRRTSSPIVAIEDRFELGLEGSADSDGVDEEPTMMMN